MLARGLFLLQARYGNQPFESLVAPAEQLARFGVPMSRALAQDVALVAGPLLADPNAASVFSAGACRSTEGQSLVQPDLATTLAQIRTAGVGDIYQGGLAGRIAQASVLVSVGRYGWRTCARRCQSATPGLVASSATTRWRSCRRRPMAGWRLRRRSACCRPTRPMCRRRTARALAVAARWRAGGITTRRSWRRGTCRRPGCRRCPASTSFVTHGPVR